QRTVGGRTLAVTTLQARHLGRAGDAPIQIATLDVRFQNGAGAFLSTSELVARVRTVSVYADALANGQFDPGADRLLVSEARLDQASGGRLVVSLRNAAPPANLNPGGSATLFVVAELNGACSADGIVRPLVRPTALTGVDALAGSPLVAEFQASGGGAEVAADPPRQLRINEVSANAIVNGIELDDWIEIFNPGPFAVQMGGMYITDDTAEPTKFRLPASLLLPAGKFLIIVADDDGDTLHANFRLSRRGETLGLFDTDARGNRPLDVISFGDQPTNVTSGRVPDGGATWRLLPAPSEAGFNVLGGLTPRLYLPFGANRSGC
ncbi:MAG: lamin tail domain-containing protein, partial [Caldilineaceae bacterium]